MTIPWMNSDPHDTAALIRQAEELASDLAEFPVRVVRMTETPLLWTSQDDSLAFVTAHLGWLMFGAPCAAMAIGFDRIRSSFPAPRDFLLALAATIAHEVGHLIQYRALSPDVFSRPPVAESREAYVTQVAALDEAESRDCVVDLAHDSAFLRIAFHLHRRAQLRHGLLLPVSAVVNTPHYGLSSGGEYYRHIEAETYELADLPIIDVLRRPAPEAFAGLWVADVLRLTTRTTVSPMEAPPDDRVSR